ncbi:MAG: formylmethanofuran dehydrogenase subunit E family protein [Candidatus Omnitrophota bacterium]
MRKISLREAVKFHGHLGPYLVLGILAGEMAIKKLEARKYFGLEVMVRGATQKPKSCLIDGLQLSAGATYGKGNIQKTKGNSIAILFRNPENKKKIRISLKGGVLKKLGGLKCHRDCEAFARELYNINPSEVFNLSSKQGS